MNTLKDQFAIWGSINWVNGAPNIEAGENFSITHLSAGKVLITVEDSFPTVPVVIVCAVDHDDIVSVNNPNKQSFVVTTHDRIGGDAGVVDNQPFNFFAIASGTAT